ncbi:MAG: DNA-directed RNA polymerase subunit omega [Acidobacteria bacterium]|nr:MAG: DNA-directed RNA polymerase subunit omega [Acidobacteriota bacterium]
MYKLPENIENKYKFVTLASKRAEQLQAGAPARVVTAGRKFTVVAQAEVAEGEVDVWEPEEEVLASDEEEE